MFNANNYGYNPYGTYIPQRPMQQPVQQPVSQLDQYRSGLNGKQVDSIDVVKAIEYPLDGSISYFPIIDGSAIVTKQLQNDGTSKTIIYKPIEDKPVDLPKYITIDELETAIGKIDLSEIDDLKEEIRDLRQEFKEFKKKKKDE